MAHGNEAQVVAAIVESVGAKAVPRADPPSSMVPKDLPAQEQSAVADTDTPPPAPPVLKESNTVPEGEASPKAAPRESGGRRKGGGPGRTIWVGASHRSLKVSHEILGAALPDAVRGFPVVVYAKYEDNVNTACKGAAIAAERLKEKGLRLTVLASFRDNRNEVTFKLDLAPAQPEEATGRGVVLTVASGTDYKVLGGAVATGVGATRGPCGRRGRGSTASLRPQGPCGEGAHL